MSRHTPVFLRESNRARVRRVASEAAQHADEVARAHNMLLPYVRRMENRALLIECRGDILLDTLMTIATLPWWRRRQKTILAMLQDVEPRAGARARGCLAAEAFALFLMGQWERIQQERAAAQASEEQPVGEVSNA